MKKRVISFFLVIALAFGLCACASNGGSSQSDEAVLAQRRDAAEAYMRKMCSILWRADGDFQYSLRSDSTDVAEDVQKYPDKVITVKAGQLYRGPLYTHGIGNLDTYLDYTTGEENGIYTLSADVAVSMNGGRETARIGNSCSGAVEMAWGQVATSFLPEKTANLTPNNGYLRVGEYKADPAVNNETKKVCEENGTQTMYAAYAQLQKADAVVHFDNGTGHVMLISSVTVVKDEEGKISGRDSKVTTIHQTNGKIQDREIYFDETLQETVHLIAGIDDEFTFSQLFTRGYLPITCKEFVDPAPLPEAKVTDSETTYTKDNIFAGTFTCPYMMMSVTVTVTDKDGNTVQEVTCYAQREMFKSFPLETFTTEDPRVLLGSLDLTTLTAGEYHCTHVCRLVTGEEITVRDFDFTV